MPALDLGKSRISGKVSPLLGIPLMVVEFLAPVDVSRVAVPLGSHGELVEVVRRDREVVPPRRRLTKERLESVTIDPIVGRQAAEVDQRRIDVLQGDRTIAGLTVG